MNEQFTPAPYSPTDIDESAAIVTLQSRIDKIHVRDHLNKGDKTPNIDGYLEIVDENQVPLGKIDVQVKKIPKGDLSYPCKRELFEYSEKTTLPVILICVDIVTDKIFWRHIKKELLIGKEQQKSLTLKFSEEDEINDTHFYLAKWMALIKEYQVLLKEGREYKLSLDKMRSLTIPIQGLSRKDILSLQTFIDELNRLLNSEYKVVKNIIFPDVWKIGVAIHSFNNENVHYSLFSVENGSTDLLVKYIPLTALNKVSAPIYGFLRHWGKNSIKTEPILAAKQFIYQKLLNVVKEKVFVIRDEYLCREYLFDYIDSHRLSLGLVKKDKYSIQELVYSLYKYMPKWCEISVNLVKYPVHLDHIDPGLIESILPPDKRAEINKEVIKAITERAPYKTLYMGDLFYSLRSVYEAISYLIEKGIAEIDRVYRDRKAPGMYTGNHIWDGYTQEVLDYNASMLFKNLEKTYINFVKVNSLDSSVYKLFKEYDKIIILHELKEQYVGDYPKLDTFCLKLIEGTPETNKIDCFKKTNFTGKIDFNDYIMEYNGRKYNIIIHSHEIADFLFERTPMLNKIYRYLKEQVEEEFREAKNM